MEQLIRIVQKTNIKTDAIFSSQLKTRRSKDGLSGYQSTFEEYVTSLRDDSPNDEQCRGGVHASLDKSAVSSLWDEVQGVIEYSNPLAKRFLNLFGIEQGNGLSPYLTSIATPSDMKDQILQFFKPPKLDNRGRGASVMSGSTTNLDDNHINEVNDNGEDEDNHPTMDPMNALSPEMIASHVSFINDCNSESATDN